MYHSRDGFYDNIPTGDSVGGSARLCSGRRSGLDCHRRTGASRQAELLRRRVRSSAMAFLWIRTSSIRSRRRRSMPGSCPLGFRMPIASVPPLGRAAESTGHSRPCAGFRARPAGVFPDGDQPGATMSADPRTCARSDRRQHLRGYEDGSREVVRAQLNVDWDLGLDHLHLHFPCRRLPASRPSRTVTRSAPLSCCRS